MTTFAETFGFEPEELMDFLLPYAWNLGLRHDAEDAVHDAYLRMAKARPAEPIRNGRAYAYRVLSNVAVGRAKSKSRLTTPMDPDDLAVAGEKQARSEADLRAEVVHSLHFDRMLEEVTAPQAEVIALRFRPNGDVRSYEEISELTGRTAQALRQSFHDGVQKLRRNRLGEPVLETGLGSEEAS